MNTVNSPLPAWLAALTHRLTIDADDWATRGRLELKVDDHPRVTLRPGRGRDVEFECRLALLPTDSARREMLLDRLMLRVCASAPTRTGIVALAADGEQLLLQATLSDEAPHAVEEGLQAFLNDLDYWTVVIREQA